MKNRLNLDFTLTYQDERKAYIDTYLPTLNSPTEDELTLISDYILWGVDRDTNQTENQKKNFQLQSKNSVWRSESDSLESIEALTESPTFNEASLLPLSVPLKKTKKEKFSREAALKESPHFLRPVFEELFAKIDRLDLSIRLFDFMYGKKGKEVKAPSEVLLAKFTDSEIESISEEVAKWTPYVVLKKRRELVRLCTEQYTLRDTYTTQFTYKGLTPLSTYDTSVSFEAGIEVLPLGLKDKSKISELLFSADGINLRPGAFDEQQLQKISDLYWRKKEFDPSNKFYFDFCREDHVYILFQLFTELAGEVGQEVDSTLGPFLKTLEFYTGEADLNEIQREILELKISKVKNQEIADKINKKYEKSYAPNYISTIFTQRIVPKICAAAKYHQQVVENLWFEEEFKVCSCCGKILLKDSINFTHKSRAKDGFMARCKRCEKEARNGR